MLPVGTSYFPPWARQVTILPLRFEVPSDTPGGAQRYPWHSRLMPTLNSPMSLPSIVTTMLPPGGSCCQTRYR